MKSYKELIEGAQSKLRAARALDKGHQQKAAAEDKERKAKPAVTPPAYSPAPRHSRKAPLPQDSPRHSRTAMRNKQAERPADKGIELIRKKQMPKPAAPTASKVAPKVSKPKKTNRIPQPGKASARDRIAKRKSGIMGGVKSALGGDTMMRARKTDSPNLKKAIYKSNRNARAEKSKKLVNGVGKSISGGFGDTFNPQDSIDSSPKGKMTTLKTTNSNLR